MNLKSLPHNHTEAYVIVENKRYYILLVILAVTWNPNSVRVIYSGEINHNSDLIKFELIAREQLASILSLSRSFAASIFGRRQKGGESTSHPLAQLQFQERNLY